MPGELIHDCRCGKVRMRLDVPGRSAGTRVTCYCRDCQTAARLNGDGDKILGPAGGTDIYQTTPDRLTIERGAEELEIVRLSPKGLMRWHARCCDTPMVNTLERLALPFVGLVLRPDQRAAADAVLGPVVAHAFTASAPRGEGAPAKDVHFARTGGQLVMRMIAAALSGRARHNPLRAPDGTPIAPVRVVDRATREAARPPG